jgi:hypothetical protein
MDLRLLSSKVLFRVAKRHDFLMHGDDNIAVVPALVRLQSDLFLLEARKRLLSNTRWVGLLTASHTRSPC